VADRTKQGEKRVKNDYFTYFIPWCEFFNFIEGDVYTHDTENQLILK